MPITKRPKKDIKAKLPADHVGKTIVTRYEPELALAIVQRIAEGELLTNILKEPNMPAMATFSQWRLRYPALDKAIETAREASAEFFEDEALRQANWLVKNNSYTGTKVQAIRAAMDQYRWTAAKRSPSRYGNHGTNMGVIVPIQINTTLDLGGTQQEDIYKINLEVPEEAQTEDTLADIREADAEPKLDGQTVKDVLEAKEEFPPKRPRGRPVGWRKGPHKTEAQTKHTRTIYAKTRSRGPVPSDE